MSFDLAVVGSGPAGMAAAARAAEHGLRVALIDSAPQLGGQFWRHGAGESGRGAQRSQHGWRKFLTLQDRLVRCVRLGQLEHLAGQQVWFVEQAGSRQIRLHLRPQVHGVAGQRLADRAASSVRHAHVDASSVVVSTGACDRQLPVPGWDLPGVMSAGGVQALLKGHHTLVGRRVLLAGTGPFLLPVATGLADAGARVVAVCEANSPGNWTRDLPGAMAVPAKGIEAVGYAARFARHRIPYLTRTGVTEVLGGGEVRAAKLGRFDASGQWRTDARTREVQVDAVAFGWGFTPSLELLTSLGVDTRLDHDESLVAQVDSWQRTSVPAVFAAGEVTGVGGALLSQAEGELAGLAVARDHGRVVGTRDVRRLQRRIARARAFAAAMHHAHPIPTGWAEQLTDGTTLCRCEEVTVGDVRATRTDLDATDARTVKMLARPGMGWCQGRICGYACAKLAADGRPLVAADLAPTQKRPLAAPVSLATLAGQDEGSP